ncbi:MAG: hypothetical protein ACRC7N_01545 [Clostridium sp.]
MFNGLKSLKRIGFKAFLIVIQLALGLSILNTCIITYSDKQDQLETFNKDNYEVVPVILGKGYMDKLKVGDIVERKWDPSPTGYIQYEVIGFYEDSAIPRIEFTHEGIGSLTYSDYLIIVPTSKCISRYSIENLSSEPGLLLEVDSPAQMKIVEDELNKVTKDDNIYVNVRPLKEDYLNIAKMCNRVINIIDGKVSKV